MSLTEVNADHAAALAEQIALYGRTLTVGGVSVTAMVHTRSRSDGYDNDGGRDIPEEMTVVASSTDFSAAQIAALNQDTEIVLTDTTYELTGLTKTDKVLSIAARKK